jgi:hypothetical protein
MEFSQVAEWEEIPFILKDPKQWTFSNLELFNYFSSRFSLLDSFLKVNPDPNILEKVKDGFLKWKKVSKEKEGDLNEFENQFKELKQKIEIYFQDFWIEKVKKNPKFFKNAPFEVRSNRIINMIVLNHSPRYLKHSSEEIQNDQKIFSFLKQKPKFKISYPFLSLKYRSDVSIALEMVPFKQFKYFNPDIFDKEFIKKVFELPQDSIHSSFFQILPMKFYGDEEILDLICKHPYFCFKKLPWHFYHKKSLILKIIPHHRDIYLLLPLDLRMDIDFLKEFVQIRYNYSRYLSDEILSDWNLNLKLLEFNDLIFFDLKDDFKNEESFKVFLRVRTSMMLSKNDMESIPETIKTNSSLMKFAIDLAVNKEGFHYPFDVFSLKNEYYPYAIAKHIKYSLEIYLFENGVSSNYWYLDWFHESSEYLKSKIYLLGNFYSQRHLEESGDLDLKEIYVKEGESEILKDICLCISRIYKFEGSKTFNLFFKFK